MSIVKAVVLSFFITVIIRCGDAPLAGNGTGTDIGEAKVSGCVKLPGGIAAENVTVTLRKQDYVPFSVSLKDQKKVVSGKNGDFAITQPGKGYYLLELINRDSLCAIKRFYISDNDTGVMVGDCMIDTPVLFTGRVFKDGTPASGASLLVLGIDNRGTVQNDGSFSMRLPRGEQLLRVMTNDLYSTRDVLFSSGNSGDTIHSYSTPVTVLEDFENSDGLNALTTLLGGGSWWAFTDSVNGGKSRILPTAEPGLVEAIDSTSNAYRGGSLHCQFQIDQSFNASFALIGVDFSNSKDSNSSKSWFDLSKMTAFTFMAKGSGTVYVQFTCRPFGSSTDYTVYEIPVNLSSGWNKCIIRSSDIPNALLNSSAQIVSWQSGNSAVSNINFLAKGTTDLWLDDLIIEGVSASDFLK
jgi:hypothetical protein